LQDEADLSFAARQGARSIRVWASVDGRSLAHRRRLRHGAVQDDAASNGANAVCRANSDAIDPEGGIDAIAAIAGAKRPSGAP
jgi:hypothetical protein